MNYLTGQNNQMLESEIDPGTGIRFENSSFMYFGIERESEYINEICEVRPGYFIPEATFSGWSTFLWYRVNEARDTVLNLRLDMGDYYTGKRYSVNPEIELTISNRLQAEFDFDMNYVFLPEGEFSAKTFGCRLYYVFSTKFYVKAYLQYNDDRLANDGDSIWLANVLLRWTYRPGSDFYIVYNDRRLFGASNGDIANRTLMAKATFFWRK